MEDSHNQKKVHEACLNLIVNSQKLKSGEATHENPIQISFKKTILNDEGKEEKITTAEIKISSIELEVLKMASKPFTRMLSSGFKEAQSNRIEYEELTEDVFRQILIMLDDPDAEIPENSERHIQEN